ncbi:MAG: DNA-processing protein DprA [Candidatus Omnitrophica bacterium]|nr:DNA-processing protein DprA [Candidatus Omnitrophota bacterium]
MRNKEDLLLLNMAGVGKKRFDKLSKDGLAEKLNALKTDPAFDLIAELKLIKKHNVHIVTVFDTTYPGLLKEIFDPPLLLYVKGKILKDDEISIGIVGSRIASIYGQSTAERLGYELSSRGAVIISGLARGIDSAAHKGSIKAHGKTVAVLGNGLSTIYPPENEKLANTILEKGGAVISEFPMTTPPVSKNFPQRNRVISGLSLALIVVEAAKNSGALITADFALEQGREVFAVPGMVNSPTSFGTNELIKQGSRLLQSSDDVIEELRLKLSPSKTEEALKPPSLSGEEEAVYRNISLEPKYLDGIAQESGFPVSKTIGLLLKLQFKKLVKELPGKNFIKSKE